MEFESFAIDGPLLLTQKVRGDERGCIVESWNARSFAAVLGVSEREAPLFSQNNHSRFGPGVLRRLHDATAPGAPGEKDAAAALLPVAEVFP